MLKPLICSSDGLSPSVRAMCRIESKYFFCRAPSIFIFPVVRKPSCRSFLFYDRRAFYFVPVVREAIWGQVYRGCLYYFIK